MNIFSLFFFGILFFLSPLFAETEIPPDEFRMTAYLDSENPIILEYEVEFWREKEGDVLNGKNFPISKLVPPGRVVLSVPQDYQFFRVRAVARMNIRGFWTEFNQIRRYPLTNQTSQSPKQVFVPRPQTKPDVFLSITNSKNENLTYLTRQNVILQSFDDTETKLVHYRFSGEPWKKEAKPSLEIAKDGFYELEYRAEDALGNVEKSNYLSFYVDQTPPKTDLQFQSESFRKGEILYLSPKLKIGFSVEEEGSGLDYSLFRNYCKGESPGDWIQYKSPIPFSILSEKSCKNEILLEYYSVDKVGNKESVSTLTFRLP